jgi:ParB family chromosome partitioning protein
LVRKVYQDGHAVKNTVKSGLPPALKKIEDNLASRFSTKVILSHNKKGRGSVTFEYYSVEELNALLDKFNINVH